MIKPTPPTIGTTKPRNDFGPTEYRAILDLLSMRRAAQMDRLSSISKLRGV